MTDIDQIRFRPGDLLPAIAARIDPADGAPSMTAAASRTVQRLLDHYMALLDHALASVVVTMGEARVLVALHSSFPFQDMDGDQLIAAIALLPQRVREELATYDSDAEDCDPHVLLGKVQQWTTLQRAAVLDALHRFWIQAGDTTADVDALIVAVGLVRRG